MTQPSIITVGELLVEFVSHRKGCALRELSDYSGPYPSGAPAICIEQAARMGANCKIVGSLGADNFGAALIDRLQSNGVDTSNVLQQTDKSTGVAFVSYYENGDRTFIFHLNNTAADAVSTNDFSPPEGPCILHISGSSLGNPHLRTAILTAATKVVDHGGEISCDPNARAELLSDRQAHDALMRILSLSTYIFPSTSDLDFLYPGQSEDSAINALLGYGAQLLVLKRGEQGAVIFNGAERTEIVGFSVEEIDPTGAGDCFCGTFIAMIAQGHSPTTAGRFANAAGALAVTKRGPMEGNSSLEMIEQFIASNQP